MFDVVCIERSYRPESEDRTLTLGIGECLVIAVADGAGGISGGACAADMFIEHVRCAACRGTRKLLDLSTWAKCMQRADESIRSDAEAGECAGVVVAVSEYGEISGASVGDCEAWVLHPRSAVDLTSGQERKPFLGTGCAFPVPFHADHAKGRLLVGTDGLFKYADRRAIRGVCESGELGSAAEALVSLVRANHKCLPDDLGLVLCGLA